MEVVEEPDVVDFSRRIRSFYGALEHTRMDALMTFEDDRLRSFFAGPSEFSDYYASLASQLRAAQVRHAMPDRVEIREFRFEGAERARVELTILGHHQRSLRFWDIELTRVDTWERVDGTWLVTPEKL